MAFNGQLTSGAIPTMYNNVPLDGFSPVVQIIDVKQIQTAGNQQNPERFRLVISDSSHYLQAMLATQLNSLIKDGTLNNLCVVRLNDFICNTVHNRRIVIILNVELVSGPLPSIIGNPINLEQSLSQGAAGTATQVVRPNNNTNFNQSNNQSGAASPIKQAKSTPQQSVSSNRPSSNSAQQFNVAGSTIPTSTAMVDNQQVTVYPIKSLNPYQNRWTIKARVNSKSEMRTWNSQKGTGRLFSIDLVDAHGGEIRATMFNEAADKWMNIFEVDKVYYISKGNLKTANRKFNTLKNDYELTLDQNSTIQLCPDASDIPKLHFTFSTIDQILNLNKDDFVDVLAVVTQVDKIVPITTRQQRQTSKRNITLLDSSSRSTEFTLWGTQAENPVWENNSSFIIAVKAARVNDYNGNKSLTSVSSTHIEFSPDITEAHALRSWFDSTGRNVQSYPISQTRSFQGGDDPKGPVERRTFAQIKDEGANLGDKAAFYDVKGTVSTIKHEPTVQLWYNACETCNKKVFQDTSTMSWRCENCNKTVSGPVPRYILQMSCTDHTANSWLSCFNDAGAEILGVDASTLAHKKDNDPVAFEQVFQDAIFKQFIFRIKAKKENYNGETKVRLQIVKAIPVDFQKESEWLLQHMNE